MENKGEDNHDPLTDFNQMLIIFRSLIRGKNKYLLNFTYKNLKPNPNKQYETFLSNIYVVNPSGGIFHRYGSWTNNGEWQNYR